MSQNNSDQRQRHDHQLWCRPQPGSWRRKRRQTSVKGPCVCGGGGTGNRDFLQLIFGYRHVLKCYNATNFQMVQKRETERGIEQNVAKRS